MSRNILLYGVLIFVLSVVTAGFINTQLNKNVAFVRSQELIYNYEGTKEAMAVFNNKKQQWQANVDTLKFEFQRAVSRYNQDFTILSLDERKKREKALDQQERQLITYTEAIESKIQKADNEMMQGVLNQINAFIEEYSKENDYDIVLGTTVSGNVLYGTDALDITENVLKKLNERYRGE